MRRHWVILVAMSAAASVFDHRTPDRGDTANRADDARHVIVVVSDGMRWQEVFRGADSTILFSDQAGPAADADAARRKYWRPTATDRRAAVHRQVLPYVDRQAPRALFVGFAETDDWGHEGRYDRFLDAAHAVDAYLADLWAAVQSNPRYRDRTTLIFTADHGRGRLATDWRHHGGDVAGAEETFLITAGPGGSLRGEVRGTDNVLGDVAVLTAAAVGLRYDRACAARADGLVRRLASALTRADCLTP